MFCSVGTIPSTAVICCCSRVNGAGVDAAAAGPDGPGDVDGPAVAFVGAGGLLGNDGGGID